MARCKGIGKILLNEAHWTSAGDLLGPQSNTLRICDNNTSYYLSATVNVLIDHCVRLHLPNPNLERHRSYAEYKGHSDKCPKASSSEA